VTHVDTYDMMVPCSDCPFRIGPNAIRLRNGRAQEITETDGEFPCHKTVEDTGGTGPRRHCAGFLIYREKRNDPSQMMRIAERVGLYDRRKLHQGSFAQVIDEAEEMVG